MKSYFGNERSNIFFDLKFTKIILYDASSARTAQLIHHSLPENIC
jgi:hypothetical protein